MPPGLVDPGLVAVGAAAGVLDHAGARTAVTGVVEAQAAVGVDQLPRRVERPLLVGLGLGPDAVVEIDLGAEGLGLPVVVDALAPVAGDRPSGQRRRRPAGLRPLLVAEAATIPDDQLGVIEGDVARIVQAQPPARGGQHILIRGVVGPDLAGRAVASGLDHPGARTASTRIVKAQGAEAVDQLTRRVERPLLVAPAVAVEDVDRGAGAGGLLVVVDALARIPRDRPGR